MKTIDTLKSKREEANKIVEDIKVKFQIIEENFEKSKSILANHEINSKETKKINLNLNNIIISTNEAIDKFRKQKDRVSSLLTQVNNFYEKKYLPLLNKIEDDENGFKAKLKQGTQFEKEINYIKESSKNQYEEVKKFAKELRVIYKGLLTLNTSINTISNNIINKKSKIDDIYLLVSELYKKINNIHSNLNILFNESKNNERRISELLNKSNNEYDNIIKIKKNSEELLTKIQEVYEIAADTGLSGEFDKRRKHLEISLKEWQKRIFVTTLILLIVVIMMFIGQLWLYDWDMKSHTFDINFYIRFLIASPIVYYLYFCSSQYAQSKRLHDKYSFKTTLAMSIKNHIQLLTENEKFLKEERINKILDFVLDGFNKIYVEPYSNDDYKLKLKLSNIEMEIEKKIYESLSKVTGIDINKNNKT